MTPLSDSEARTVQRFENAEPAPESWGGGLREVIARALHHDWHADEEWDAIPDSVSGYYRRLADVTLALPGLAALRDLATWLVSLDDDDPDSPGRQDRRTVTLGQIADRARAALDGDQP